MRRPITRDDFELYLIRKAWADPDFLQELRANPKAALASEMNQDALPDDLEIEVLEETPNKLYLVLPVRPDTDTMGRAWLSREHAVISRDELDQVLTSVRDNHSTFLCYSV